MFPLCDLLQGIGHQPQRTNWGRYHTTLKYKLSIFQCPENYSSYTSEFDVTGTETTTLKFHTYKLVHVLQSLIMFFAQVQFSMNHYTQTVKRGRINPSVLQPYRYSSSSPMHTNMVNTRNQLLIMSSNRNMTNSVNLLPSDHGDSPKAQIPAVPCIGSKCSSKHAESTRGTGKSAPLELRRHPNKTIWHKTRANQPRMNENPHR